jgi:hypothetical protein
MLEPLAPDAEQRRTGRFFFHCMACGDIRPVGLATRHCLCGRTCAREVDDEVLVCGPGRVSRTGVLLEDRDAAPARRPRVALH